MKVVKYIALILLIVLLGACDTRIADNESGMKNDSAIIRYDPVFDESILNSVFEGLKITPETDYRNITADLNKNVFSPNDTIRCHIINNNLGKGFSVFSVMFLDYKYDEKWIRQGLETTEYPQWLVIGEEDNDQIFNETYLEINLLDIEDDLVSGEYRVVIYVGDSTLYVPFTLTDD